MGGYRGVPLSDGSRALSVTLRQDRRDATIADLAPLIAELQSDGITSPKKIAAALNARGVPAVRGGAWSPGQVGRAVVVLVAVVVTGIVVGR